jgi:hypothetical protein
VHQADSPHLNNKIGAKETKANKTVGADPEAATPIKNIFPFMISGDCTKKAIGNRKAKSIEC